MIGLPQNQRYMIRDCSACVFDPVKYSKLVRMVNVTAKDFYVLTHNDSVLLARSHLMKVLLLRRQHIRPSAGFASMNARATSQHMSTVSSIPSDG